MPALNIFHLSPFPFRTGGIDTWLEQFLAVNRGIRVRLFCPRPEKVERPLRDTGHLPCLSVYFGGTWRRPIGMVGWGFRVIPGFMLRARRDCPSIVLSTIPTMMPVAVMRGLGYLRGKIVCSVRGSIVQDAIDLRRPTWYVRILRRMEKSLLCEADVLVANGWDTQDYLRRIHRLPSIVIPNAVGARAGRRPADASDARLIEGLRRDHRYVVMHIGTLRRVKGIDSILRAASELARRGDQIAFVFIGKGDISRYRAQARREGVTAAFLGEKDNPDAYLALADAVVNVSGGSGVSNSLLEALAAGKRVVAWDCRTYSQVIRHGVNGYLASLGNVGELATCIASAARNVPPIDSDVVRRSVAGFSWDMLNARWLDALFGSRPSSVTTTRSGKSVCPGGAP